MWSNLLGAVVLVKDMGLLDLESVFDQGLVKG
jgi:hypothetical protein